MILYRCPDEMLVWTLDLKTRLLNSCLVSIRLWLMSHVLLPKIMEKKARCLWNWAAKNIIAQLQRDHNLIMKSCRRVRRPNKLLSNRIIQGQLKWLRHVIVLCTKDDRITVYQRQPSSKDPEEEKQRDEQTVLKKTSKSRRCIKVWENNIKEDNRTAEDREQWRELVAASTTEVAGR